MVPPVLKPTTTRSKSGRSINLAIGMVDLLNPGLIFRLQIVSQFLCSYISTIQVLILDVSYAHVSAHDKEMSQSHTADQPMAL